MTREKFGQCAEQQRKREQNEKKCDLNKILDVEINDFFHISRQIVSPHVLLFHPKKVIYPSRSY